MYIIYLICSILLLLEEYIRLSTIGFDKSFLSEEAFIIIFLVASIGYLFKNRRNNLFCFETFFLVFSFLIIFYDYLVLSVTFDAGLIGSLFGSYTEAIINKTLYVSILATLFFILGCYISDKRNSNITGNQDKCVVLDHHLNTYALKQTSKILVIITIVYFGFLYVTGYISTWFSYSADSTIYTNTKVVYLTVLCLSCTVSQFSMYAGQRFSSLWDFIKRLDKSYVGLISIVSFLLLISGNRNEALYIILPAFVCYSIFVKNITNKEFLAVFIIGFFIMVVIGLTRQTGVLNSIEGSIAFNLFDFTRDFGFANIDSMYLIEDTDKNGTMGFNMGIITLLSSIPFLAGILVPLFGIEEFTRSAVATTEGMGISYTGLGTSLVGDAYYTGGIIFTLVYFYLLGKLMSYFHNRFYHSKIINIYTLVIYSFMFSNSIYCLRSEWYTSFRYIGFSICVLFVLLLLSKRKI